MTPADVRLRGFPDRASLEEAHAWIDRHAAIRRTVQVETRSALGRVVASPVRAPLAVPAEDRAAEDGWAVRAEETFGATPWAPVPLVAFDGAGELPRGAARLVYAGALLPGGADAIVAFDAAQAAGGTVEVTAPIAQGSGVDRAGQQLGPGASLADPGRPLRVHALPALAAAGVERISVVAAPRILLAVAGPKGKEVREGNAGALTALVTRDGGDLERAPAGLPLRDVLAATDPGRADLILSTGRTGTGPDDDAAPALAAAGELAFHGLAIRPGGSCGLGHVRGVPVVLLPGDGLACLCAYELLAGRLVRRLAGRSPELPHAVREVPLARKIVSVVGSVDVCQVRLVDGRAEPLGIVEAGGLGAALRADGFVVVPAPLEGHPPGAHVAVHLY